MPAPPAIPVLHFQSPAFGDTMLVEAHNTELGSYVELPIGTPHPNVEKWSGYTLVKQQAFDGDEKWIQRFWSDDPAVQNTYNLARQSYSGGANANPIYTRTYLVRRKDYAPATKLSTLSGVLYVRITAGGSGYDSTTTVAFSGGAVSGATGIPIVFRGAVVGVRITAEGTGYTSNPTVTFTGIGTGATATAGGIRQDATAYLVDEMADRMDGDPDDGIYLRVTRIYEVLPGPYLPFTRYDLLLGPIQGRRRAVANTGQTATLTATVKTTYEAREGSSIVSWEIEETNSDGTGGAGNPAYPITVEDEYEEVRGAVHRTIQLTTDLTSPGSFSTSTPASASIGGYTITSAGTGYSTIPTVTFSGGGGADAAATAFIGEVTAGGAVGVLYLLITNPGSGYTSAPTIAFSSGGATATAILSKTATKISYDPYNQFLRRKITETWSLPGPKIITSHRDPESGILISVGKTLKLRSEITESHIVTFNTPGTAAATSVLTVIEIERTGIANTLGMEVVTSYPPAAAYSSGTAIEEEKDGPYRYVGRININNASAGLNIGDLDLAGVGIEASISTHDPNPSAEITTITRKTWFVNALTKPTVGILEMQPRSIRFTDGVSNGNFSGVLFDQFRLNFNGAARTIGATSPTFTEYFALIGTDIVIDGGAEEIRRYRWRVTTDSVVAR